MLIDCSDILEEDEMHQIGDGHCDKNLFVYHCWFDAGDCYGTVLLSIILVFLKIQSHRLPISLHKLSYLTSRLTKGQRKPPIEVSISRKSVVGFEGLLVHNNF